MTDGQENSSKEFKKDMILSMIKEKSEKDGWAFVYMGSEQSTWDDAQVIGIAPSATMSYTPTGPGTTIAYTQVSNSTLKYLKDRKSGKKDKFSF